MNKFLIIAVVFVFGLTGCNKCKNEDPRARVSNEGSKSVSVHIETSGGNTININNIDGGQISEFESYSAGDVEFTITVGNGNTSTQYTYIETMEECFEYDIVIDEDNNISSIPTDRNE